MSNELVVLTQETALSVLTNQDHVKSTIEHVKEQILSMDGGSLDTKTGRKVIRSNAFKATKAKTGIKSQHVDPLIEKITGEIQPKLDTIKAIKDNFKLLGEGLDDVRKEINIDVDAIDAKIKAEEDAKIAAAKAVEDAKQYAADWEIACLLNEKIDRELAEIKSQEAKAHAEQAAQAKADQEAREKRIAEEAAAKAKADAEAATRRAIEAEHLIKQQAIQAEANRKAAEAQAAVAAEKAAEQARLAEVERRRLDDVAAAEEQAKREADKKHIGATRKAAKEALMALGIDEAMAKTIVKAIHNKAIPNVQINY